MVVKYYGKSPMEVHRAISLEITLKNTEQLWQTRKSLYLVSQLYKVTA